jgi:hypothetical protein
MLEILDVEEFFEEIDLDRIPLVDHQVVIGY